MQNKLRLIGNSLVASGISIVLLAVCDRLLLFANSSVQFFPNAGFEELIPTAILIWALCLPATLCFGSTILKRIGIACLFCALFAFAYCALVLLSKPYTNYANLFWQFAYVLLAGSLTQLLMFANGEYPRISRRLIHEE